MKQYAMIVSWINIFWKNRNMIKNNIFRYILGVALLFGPQGFASPECSQYCKKILCTCMTSSVEGTTGLELKECKESFPLPKCKQCTKKDVQSLLDKKCKSAGS